MPGAADAGGEPVGPDQGPVPALARVHRDADDRRGALRVEQQPDQPVRLLLGVDGIDGQVDPDAVQGHPMPRRHGPHEARHGALERSGLAEGHAMQAKAEQEGARVGGGQHRLGDPGPAGDPFVLEILARRPQQRLGQRHRLDPLRA